MATTFGLALVSLAAVLQAGFLLRRENRRDPVSHWLLAAAAVLLFAALVNRSFAIGFPAVTTAYETLVLFSAITCVVLFALRMVRRTRGFSPFVLFGATLVCVVLLALSLSRIAPRAVQLPVTELRSPWLVLHVTFTFIGEAFFVVGLFAALAFLAIRNTARRADMGRLTTACIGLGYPAFTAGALILGAIWTGVSVGQWWRWRPQEILTVVTWLLYSACLLVRLLQGKMGKASALLAIIGFVGMIVAIFEENSMFAMLHRQI